MLCADRTSLLRCYAQPEVPAVSLSGSTDVWNLAQVRRGGRPGLHVWAWKRPLSNSRSQPLVSTGFKSNRLFYFFFFRFLFRSVFVCPVFGLPASGCQRHCGVPGEARHVLCFYRGVVIQPATTTPFSLSLVSVQQHWGCRSVSPPSRSLAPPAYPNHVLRHVRMQVLDAGPSRGAP